VQHRYNLLVRDIESEVLPFCTAENIGVLSWSSLAEGLLADTFDREQLDPKDFRRDVRDFQDPRYRRIRELVASVAEVAAESGHSATDLAIAWLLSQKGITGAIVGARSPKELGAASAAARWAPGEDVLRRVDRAVAEVGLTVGL
jgi:aryl-alcohol dehydrogenase-like predicted oxidoreductase